MEAGGIFRNGNSAGVLRSGLGIPYIYRTTIALEGAIGVDGFFPPITPYNPPLIEPDNEPFARIVKSLSTYLIPLAFRFSHSHRWIYPFFGIKAVWLEGAGKTRDALDYLYASTIIQTYEIEMNLFFSFGFVKRPYVIRCDLLLTDNTGEYAISAHDPFGVGPSYYYEKGPFDEPKIFITFGIIGILGNRR